MMEGWYCLRQTEWGWLGVQSTSRGISRILLPRSNKKEALAELKVPGAGGNGVVFHENEKIMRPFADEIFDYLRGRRTKFSFEPDFDGHPSFSLKVWKLARAIPYGDTRSYSWLAKTVGTKATSRAVGQTLGKNPVPLLVPCHRVICTDGSLGGFSGGVEWKQFLLSLERRCCNVLGC